MNPLEPSKQGRVASNGIEIYLEVFGSPGHPAVVLITGMDEQCTAWCPYFYEPIVAAGYCVVRFDNRDSGHSQWINEWREDRPYTLEDMAADTLGVMDALRLKNAHLVGASMGGMIAQRLAVHRPERLFTLTSIASSGFPLDPDPILRTTTDPQEAAKAQQDLLARYPNHLDDPVETIEYRLAVLKTFAGSRFPFDGKFHREMLTHNIMGRKGFNPLAQRNHSVAVMASGSVLDELGRISVPTLVIHGTEDPLLSLDHATKCASRIPGARLVWMEGVGHELPAGIMDLVHEEMLALFSRANTGR